MRRYDEMTPVMTKPEPGEAIPSGPGYGWFQTMRRCPECRRNLTTNRHGHFHCNVCGFDDLQDVSKLYEAGLDYSAVIIRRKFGTKSHHFGTEG